jgi:TonB-linked SusC/RagA family outer membrane protein
MLNEILLIRSRRNLLLLLLVCLLSTFELYSQQGLISGKVLNGKDGNPLGGVSVSIKGGKQGTTTNDNGIFQLNGNRSNTTLVVSSIGFSSQEVSVKNSAQLIIRLEPSSGNLNEIVVVSYGTQKKRDVTGSVATINTQEVKDMPVNNIGQKLQGKLAGVQINNNTGQPGANMSFRIRGSASINASAGNSPLIVVDGFPTTSGLETISPSEIASITVLKDAAASSLYGSRANNGVILVTTKQAKSGQKSIDFSSYVGVTKVSDQGKPDLMNPQEFAEYKKEWYDDAAKYEGYAGGVPTIYQNPQQYANVKGTNWYNILLRNALTQDYNLSLSSGVKDLKSTINLNYDRQEGAVLNTYFERFTGRANNIYNVSDNLTVGVNLDLSYRNSQITPGLDNGRNIIQNAFLMDPTLNYKNADGTYPLSFSQPGMFANPNYYLVVTQRKNPVKNTTLIANAFAEYKIWDGLKYKISLNANTNNNITRQFNPSTAQGGLGSAPPQPATGNYGTSNYLTWLAENTLTYEKSFGKHNIDAFVGYTAQKYNSENSSIAASQFPDDNIQWINVATTRIGTASATESKLLSYIGRLNYNYDSKYLLSVAFRRDGSSRFGTNNKYGNFPSVSLGWVASEENFLKKNDKINFLKVRASYGKTGNYNIGDYPSIALLSTTNYVMNNSVTSGVALSGIGNAGLTWESTTQYDLGLDLELFNGRIAFTYDYYNKYTEGMLYNIDLPVQAGFSAIISNVGRINFWGHEFTIESKNLTGKLKWNTSFNISFDRNLVKKLSTNDAPIGGYNEYWDDNRTAVGHPIGLFYGYINTGVYMTQQEFDTQAHDATAMVGTARFADISGPNGKPDGKIDGNDRTYIGNPNPKFIYGMTNTFDYKNWDLAVVFAGSVGNDIADDAFQSTENLDGVFNVRKGVANRWRSLENPGTGIYPRTRAGTTADFRNFTSRQVFKADYIAGKNITVGYTLPVRPSKYMKNSRLYASVQNAFILTKYPGQNPEAGISGLNGLNQGRDFTAYPISRIYTLGVNVGF